MFHNVVIGNPLVDASELLSNSPADWEDNEKQNTLFTNTRFLPAIMKEAGIVASVSEVRRNKPDLVKTLDKPDCMTVKWGKKFLFIVVGE